MLNLTDLAIFAQVAETKSFSTAAARLGLSKGTISKHIAGLEATLNTRLLHRTTRRVSLTDAGAALLQHCVRIMAEADQAAASVVRTTAQARGVTKVAAPVTFGLRYVVPAVTDVLRAFPGIAIDLALTNHLVDMTAEKVDFALRITRDPPGSLVCRPVMPCPTVICAAPSYLARAGTPACPADLKTHSCLLYTVPTLNEFWRFQCGDEESIVPVGGHFCTDNDEAMRLAALNGAGIALMPCFYVNDDLAAGTLVSLLKDYTTPEYTAYVAYPFAHRTSAVVLALTERIIEQCSEQSRCVSAPADAPSLMASGMRAPALALAATSG